MTTFQVSCPANIALIKYMGKMSVAQNLPSNASLSYTLDHLRSRVQLTPINHTHDQWDSRCKWQPTEQQRFIAHLQFLRNSFNYAGYFEIYSENNFPSGCGLASSASSFAALTACAVQAMGATCTASEMANLSRHGSGSSCRSFFSPWAIWQKDQVKPVDLPYGPLHHQVVVVSAQTKAIKSSEAHQRVATSLLYSERTQRAEQRLALLIQALQQQQWADAYVLCWQEFQDMHALFETAALPFGYMLPASWEVLQRVRHHWKEKGDGPLVTMDAGPNVHLLFRLDQTALAKMFYQQFSTQFQVYAPTLF